jgi:hypothetical protein
VAADADAGVVWACDDAWVEGESKEGAGGEGKGLEAPRKEGARTSQEGWRGGHAAHGDSDDVHHGEAAGPRGGLKEGE